MKPCEEGQECECGSPATGICEDGLAWCNSCGRWNMDIGQAIELVKSGKRVHRSGWNGKGMYIYLMPPVMAMPDHVMSEPVVMMRTADGKRVAWLCSQSDLLATDWMDEDEH